MMIVKMIGTNTLKSCDVSIKITPNEYVILVYPAINAAHPMIMYFFLRLIQFDDVSSTS